MAEITLLVNEPVVIVVAHWNGHDIETKLTWDRFRRHKQNRHFSE